MHYNNTGIVDGETNITHERWVDDRIISSPVIRTNDVFSNNIRMYLEVCRFTIYIFMSANTNMAIRIAHR